MQDFKFNRYNYLSCIKGEALKILSIGQKIENNKLDIINISFSELSLQTLEEYSYILISGGDGAIRRIIKILHTTCLNIPPLILNPIGSFNVIAKLHRIPKYTKILEQLANDNKIILKPQAYYGLNNEIFLFSAGNMGDLQHIFLSETLRFGILEKGVAKYLLSALFLFPIHIIMTPFMLLSSRRFFIFLPAKFISKFGSFHGRLDKALMINLETSYNIIELDGDIVIIEESQFIIKPLGKVKIAKV